MNISTMKTGRYLAQAVRAGEVSIAALEAVRALDCTRALEHRIRYRYADAIYLIESIVTEARQALVATGLIEDPEIRAILSARKSKEKAIAADKTVSMCANCSHIEKDGARFICTFRRRRYHNYPCKPGQKCLHHHQKKEIK